MNKEQNDRECVDAAIEAGVEYLTLYAFSSENWKRPAPEVQGLMKLLERFLEDKLRDCSRKGCVCKLWDV